MAANSNLTSTKPNNHFYVFCRKSENQTTMKILSGLLPLLHLLSLFASVCFHQCCNAADIISASQPLQDPNFIVSPDRFFKLGFFTPVNTNNRYVGIMYNVPNITAVWVANRDKPLTDSSGVLTVSEDGNLVVLNGKKEVIWSSGLLNGTPNSTAAFLDRGNLVLTNSTNGTVWQSFLKPANCFWPGMRMGGSEKLNINITSWRTPSDPSVGNFTFGLDPLRPTPEFFVWNRGVLFGRTGPWDGNAFIGIPEMTSVRGSQTQTVTDSDGTMYFTYQDVNSTRLLHYKISELGHFEQFVIDDGGNWQRIYSSFKGDCDIYGECGPNGMCDPKGSRICSCLRGYEPRDKAEWDRENWSGGCVRRSLFQCQRNNSGEADGYVTLSGVKVPDFSNLVSVAEEECGNACLKNCSCSAYAYVVGIGCLQWGDNLLDIQQFSIRGTDLHLRVAHSELDSSGGNKKTKAIIASTVTVGCLCLAASICILWHWRIKKRGKNQESELTLIRRGGEGNPASMLNDNPDKSKLEDLPLYSYETIANATDDFHDKNKLGRGGFGPVHKGKLVTGQEIAVKRLSNSSTQGMKEFMNEVTLISKLQHRNLVRLLGCCVERAEKILVYEYLPNKSLDAYIFDSEMQDFLDWNRRCIIIEGIGRGLLYLHRDSRLRIIHRDLKASNILLDEELNPKISDFGLARIFGGKQDQADTNRVVGTYGYMAPEYAMGGNFSEKSDVYSFGVLLLEIVSGKKNSSFYHGEDNLSLLEYAWKLWNENEAVNFCFTEKHDPSAEVEISRCVQIGLLCVQDSPNDRPNMSNVLLMLNSEIVDIPRPKLPSYATTFPLPDGHFYSQSGTSNSNVSRTEVIGR